MRWTWLTPSLLCTCKQIGEHADRLHFGPPTNLYHRQYVGLELKGKRVLYANLLLILQDSPSESVWRTKAVAVCDGGNGYIGVEFDPETRTVLSLEKNGAL